MGLHSHSHAAAFALFVLDVSDHGFGGAITMPSHANVRRSYSRNTDIFNLAMAAIHRFHSKVRAALERYARAEFFADAQ